MQDPIEAAEARKAFSKFLESEANQIPRYKCFKEVWALEIKAISASTELGEDGVLLSFKDERIQPIFVDTAFIDKHEMYVTKAGQFRPGYLVFYKDGYRSFSPTKPFEDGYIPVKDAEILERSTLTKFIESFRRENPVTNDGLSWNNCIHSIIKKINS